MKSIIVEGGNVRGGWNFFFKINKRASTFIREMRVGTLTKYGYNVQFEKHMVSMTLHVSSVLFVLIIII